MNNCQLVILYGGETGNCEDIAKRMLWESHRRKISTSAYSIEDYNILNLINEKYVVFICSTTGQGQLPSSMKFFWSFIMKKSLPCNFFSSLMIAVVGLGDSSYLKYNITAKKLYKRFIQLGAQPLLDIALGDDQHDLGYGAAIDPWLKKFWQIICNKLKISYELIDDDKLPINCFNYIQLDKSSKNYQFNNKNAGIYNQSSPFFCKVISNERVTAQDHFQEVRFVKLKLDPKMKLSYLPGDVAMIYPQNSFSDVNEFINLLKLDRNEKFIIEENKNICIIKNIYNHLPKPCTIEQLVRDYLDIHSIPKRSFFELFWKFSEDEIEKKKLKQFASTEGQQELYFYCYQPKRTILEVLYDFPETSANIKFDYIFDLIPPIRSRAYSIASDLTTHPQELHILVVVINYRTKLKVNRLGLCSNYIQKLKEGDEIKLWLKKGKFKLYPENCAYIMVGPGTGVAPFRSILEHRIDKNINENFLFFGCRYSSKDFYFKKEWLEYESKNMMKLFTAFSRQEISKKVYVQDVMLQESKLIWKLLQNGGILLVAGSSKNMPQDVREAIGQIIRQHIKEENIENIINKLESTHRIQYDCW